MPTYHDDGSSFNIDNTPLWMLTAAREEEYRREMEQDEFWRAYCDWSDSLVHPSIEGFLQTDEGAQLYQSISDRIAEGRKYDAYDANDRANAQPESLGRLSRYEL